MESNLLADGKYLATAIACRLVIRDIESLQITQLYTCLDEISVIEWDCESKYILCGEYKRGIVQVWSLHDAKWSAKIDEGPAGLVKARWSPDGRYILNSADFQLRITIWSMVNKSARHIKFPKFGDHGLNFSNDGNYMALLERDKECRDHISVFSTSAWDMISHFPIETNDAVALIWSPDDHFIAVRDSSISYGIFIYSIDGRKLAKYSAYENRLGVKSMSFSPSSQLLAVGSYDDKIRLLNNITFRIAGEFTHLTDLSSLPSVGTVIYKEVDKDININNGSGEASQSQLSTQNRTKFVIADNRISLNFIKPDPTQPNPKIGVSSLEWSCDSRYLATKSDAITDALWIWDLAGLNLISLIFFKNSVKSFKWDPVKSRLAITTGSTTLYLWTPAACSCVQIPSDSFFANNVMWNPFGNSAVLFDKERICVCFDAV